MRTITFLLCLILVPSCNNTSEDPDPDSTTDTTALKTIKSQHAPYELVLLRSPKSILGTQPLEGTINEIKVQITPKDTLACFMLPGLTNGPYTLRLTANNTVYTVPVVVVAVANLQSPETYFTAAETQMLRNFTQINTHADALIQDGGLPADYLPLKQDVLQQAALLSEYKTRFQNLSAADKQEFARAMAANAAVDAEFESLTAAFTTSATALRSTQAVSDYEAGVEVSMGHFITTAIFTAGHIPLILMGAKLLVAAPNPGVLLALALTVGSFEVHLLQLYSITGILLSKALKPYEGLDLNQTVFQLGQELDVAVTAKYRTFFQGDEATFPGGSLLNAGMAQFTSFRSSFNEIVNALPQTLRPSTRFKELRTQYSTSVRNVFNRYLRVSNVSNPNVTLTQLNQADGGIRLRATTSATTNQPFSYDLTYTNGKFSNGLTKRVTTQLIASPCSTGTVTAPVINGTQVVCNANNIVSIQIAFTANGPGILPSGGSLYCDPTQTCYPVRLYFLSPGAPAYSIAYNGYSASLLSGTVNQGVVEIRFISCRPNMSARASMDATYPNYLWKVELMNMCNQRSAQQSI
ncbi:hypothetical protein GCM10022406_25960 [Hymenobacter algoricola]|uniref:DUF4369 domain-containing protein n=2 Tax=Hymenobacter algoricola TaxID=486267 RepID=A0ABP7N9P1_9BACT